MLFQKCCCCIDLRIGCIIIAVVGLLANLGFYGTKATLCVSGDLAKMRRDSSCCGLSNMDSVCNDTFYILVAGSTIGIIGNLCLLFGAIMSNISIVLSKIAVSLYLLAEGLRILIYTSFATLAFDIFRDTKCTKIDESVDPSEEILDLETNLSLVLVGGIFGLISVFVGIYFWLCALSLFLKIGRKE